MTRFSPTPHSTTPGRRLWWEGWKWRRPTGARPGRDVRGAKLKGARRRKEERLRRRCATSGMVGAFRMYQRGGAISAIFLAGVERRRCSSSRIHGLDARVFMGAKMEIGDDRGGFRSVGVLRRDPDWRCCRSAAINIGDYFEHWLRCAAAIKEAPRISWSNWFRKTPRPNLSGPGRR